MDFFDNGIVFSSPKEVNEPFSWVEHIPFAFFVTDLLKPKVFVELGVHTGNSFNAFCQAVEVLHLDSKCYGVDHWEGDKHAGFYDNVFEKLNSFHQAHYSHFSHLLRMSFDEALSKFEDGSIDLLHIDGLHTYEAVKHDFESWLPKLSDKGVVLFHDTEVKSGDFGVWKFWGEVSKKYPSVNFKHCNGLGLLVVGKNVDKRLVKVIKELNGSFYQDFFFKLGNHILVKNELKLKNDHIRNIEAIIEEKEKKIKELTKEKEKKIKELTKEKEKTIKDLLEQLELKEQHIINIEAINNRLKDAVDGFESSVCWSVTKPLRKVHEVFLKSKSKLSKDFEKNSQSKIESGYSYVPPSKEEVEVMDQSINEFKDKPLVSVIMPVYNVAVEWLRGAVESVKSQVYPEWELCIVDDGSPSDEHKSYLRSLRDDSRIKVVFLGDNEGISGASNHALELASGEYIIMLDHDDLLTRDALFEVVKAINETGAELIYSDEDKVTVDGFFCDHHFKPDYSPDLLLSQNYVCHLRCYKKSLVEGVGGWRGEFDGSQDHDMILRVVELTDKIYHIPKVLYHWRKIPESTASSGGVKSSAWEAGRRAVESALKRRKIKGVVLLGEHFGTYRVKREIKGEPLVSIVIPFKDKPELLETCVNSILDKSSYHNFEVIGVSNNSEEDETFDLMKDLESRDERVKFFEFNESFSFQGTSIPFNFSAINNHAVKHWCNGKHIILCNNDIEVISPDWIECLLEHSQRKEVGVVGAKLYYPNNTIQHAGVIIGLGGIAGHIFKHFKKNDVGYFNRPHLIQNLSAVTAALWMVKKSVYEELNGLDVVNLPIAFNDIDFCLRAREKGFLNVFTPYCEAIHHESISRGFEDNPLKQQRFMKESFYCKVRHKQILKRGDPYYNPNLSLNKDDFSFIKND